MSYMSETINKKRISIEKVIAMIFIAIVMIATVYIAWKHFGAQFSRLFEVLRSGDEAQIEAYLNSKGQWKGMLLVFVMCVLQVVSIFIPGLVIQVSAGVIYGWQKAFLITYLGFIFGNTLVFFIARKLGNKASALFDLDHKKNPLKEKINDYGPFFVLFLAYLVPGIPNGFIPYFASRLDIRGFDFIGAVAASSWIQIICNCFAGHWLIRGDTFYVILCFAIQIVFIFIVTKKRNVILKLTNRK